MGDCRGQLLPADQQVILDRYADYYARPCPVTATKLFRAVRDYDFADYTDFLADVQRLPRVRTAGDKFKTNGSTGFGYTEYAFGPCPQFWLSEIEKTLRSPWGGDDAVYLNEVFPVPNPFPSAFTPPNWLNLNFDDPHAPDVLGTVPPGRTLVALPNRFLYMLARPDYVEILKNYHLTSLGWEPFFPPTLPVNDQMINWKSGFNFYTCAAGERHSLPIFLPGQFTRNLLNLASDDGCRDDLIEYQGVADCLCGRRRAVFHFVPHAAHQIGGSVDLAGQLRSVYKNLQFIQTGAELAVCHTTRDFFDAELLQNYWGRELKFCPGEVFFLGRTCKLPPFWNNLQGRRRVTLANMGRRQVKLP